jgi:hypothetical protein
VLLLAAASLTACGSRGAPQPPVYPNPPAVTGLTVAQRGSFAILRFAQPALATTVGSEEVELEDVEVLVYAERYPVLTAEMIVAGVHRRAEVMRADAAAEAAAASARAAQQAAAEQAAAEGREPPPPDPDAPPTTVRRRSADEDALHRVPEEIRDQWRREGLAADAVLVAAARLVNAVDVVWRDLGIPLTVINPDEPVFLPPDGEIAAASADVVEQTTYERPLQANGFLGRAAVSRSIPVEQFEELLVDEMLQVAIPVGAPPTAGLRTRYFFAVRSRSTHDTPGQVTAVVTLAPAPVPVAPADVQAAVVAQGIELTWQPPTGDLALRRLPPEALGYNVYRLAPDGIAGPTPLNPRPLTEPEYTDTTLQWGESYVWEVRALLLPPATETSPTTTPTGPRRESEGARTREMQAVDTYPPAPPSDVVATRVGSRVTLQWSSSASLDIIGYRVYRHPLPAPELPLRFNPDAEEDDPAATAPRAAQAPEGPNELVDAGWELVTPDPVPFSRATDPDADPATRYVYAVEAIDAAGNLSALALGTEPGDDDR